jgi:predicted RNase H-like HicB family nuclease
VRYAVVIEKGEGNHAAYVPDLPDATIQEIEREIQQA